MGGGKGLEEGMEWDEDGKGQKPKSDRSGAVRVMETAFILISLKTTVQEMSPFPPPHPIQQTLCTNNARN